jgi:putative addiction module killer protein
MATVEVREYQTTEGKIPLTAWLEGLRDGATRARVVARLDRLKAGLRGDWKSVVSGIFELRIDHGPGYRVYYGQQGKALILLLCGGDKSTQAKDIETAHAHWKDYKARLPKPTIPRSGAPAKRS